jgi:thioredoxin 1
MSRLMSELRTVSDLEAALEASEGRPVVFFKHSRTCGSSAQAYDEMTDLLARTTLPADLYVVPVQSSRSVSDALEARFGVRHESPQVLVVHDGRIVWHASHFRVTGEAVQRAVERMAATDASALPS